MHAHDAEIQQSVLRELARDSRVDETEVGVEVASEIVTLTGTVHSWEKRVAAQEAAHRASGVLDVVNDLRVRIPGVGEPTDTELAFAVRRALRQEPEVLDRSVRSTLSHGVVTLEGALPSWEMRERCERTVARLPGVRGVIDRIEVEPGPTATTAELLAAVEAALELQARREARRLVLRIERDRVTVAGVLHSSAEERAVIGALHGVRGVGRVVSELRIEPYAP